MIKPLWTKLKAIKQLLLARSWMLVTSTTSVTIDTRHLVTDQIIWAENCKFIWPPNTSIENVGNYRFVTFTDEGVVTIKDGT